MSSLTRAGTSAESHRAAEFEQQPEKAAKETEEQWPETWGGNKENEVAEDKGRLVHRESSTVFGQCR